MARRAIDQYDSGVWSQSRFFAGNKHVFTYTTGNTRFQHTDWLGTMRQRTNASGVIVQSCSSGPFGDNLSCTGSTTDQAHFVGDFLDPESNLTQAPGRYLSTTAGRWTVPDPQGRITR